MKRKQAFTLIELLVVVAIMLILVAVLFPALNYTKEHAKETVCLGNTHTMTVVALEWLSDHGDHAYPGFPYTAVPNPSVNWDTELIPTYLPKALRCPSKPANSGNNSMGYDYGWRYCVHQVLGDLGAGTAVVSPSRIVIIGEMYYTQTGFYSADHFNLTS
ncbi:MAG: type II secretion system protein, partial [Chthoniobacterales bacterium]